MKEITNDSEFNDAKVMLVDWIKNDATQKDLQTLSLLFVENMGLFKQAAILDFMNTSK